MLNNIKSMIIQNAPGGKVNILGGHNIGHSKQKIYMYMCPIPNGFRNRAISVYSALLLLFFFIWSVRLLALRPPLAYCASLG
jgi:hypothetical protein